MASYHHVFAFISGVPDASEIYSEKDTKDLEKLMADTKTWFMDNWKKQNETSSEKNPVLLSKDIYAKQQKLDREVAYLLNKAKYHVPKPKPKPAANSTASANSTKAEKPGDKTNAKGEEKKSEEKKSDDKKSDDEKSDDEKSEDNKTEEKKGDSSEKKEEKVEPLEKPEVIIDDPKTTTTDAPVDKDTKSEL